MAKIRAVVFGAGNMGRVAIECMLDHGVEIVAAVGRKRNIGRDIGEMVGRAPIGVLLEDDADRALERVGGGADIAMIFTESGLSQIAELVKKCLRRRMNVITIAEEAIFPWATAPELAKELDEMCLEYGVTLYGTGTHDVFWSSLLLDLASASNRITGIKSINFLPLEGMGKVVAEELSLGMTLDEYERATANTPPESNPLAASCLFPLYSNCRNLRMHPSDMRISIEPIPAARDTRVEGWDMTIRAGTIIGMTVICALNTLENVTWDFHLIFKVTTEPEETPSVEWIVEGDPGLHVTVEDMKGERTTSITAVNRIPDVINASPGFKTLGDLAFPYYRLEPMENYLNARQNLKG